jgi:acyl carrier protein
MSMKAADVFEFLKDAVLELKDVEPEDITRNTELETLDLESLDYVDIQVNIQKTYKVAVVPDVFTSGQIITMGQLADYIVAEASLTENPVQSPA